MTIVRLKLDIHSSVFDTHIGDETEHTAIGDVELVILVSEPLADVLHKFKFIELILRALRDVGINDQERTINLMKLAKQETHSTNDHSPPNIRHSFQTRDASMHDSIIDNNGRKEVVSATMVLVDT
jgi:hypothetical protein